MNENQRNELTEQELADRTVERLGSVATHEGTTEHELGGLLRKTVEVDLPASNVELRQEMLEQFKNERPQELASSPGSKPWFSRKHGWRLGAALACSLMLGIGAWALYWADLHTQEFGVAKLITGEEKSSNSAGSSSLANAKPVVRWRTETRTGPVAVTKTRKETRTREVPVSRMRTEKQTKTLPDGKVVETTVQVPYTENVTQNYTVNIPYTENVTETYRVEVPYVTMPDGRELGPTVVLNNELRTSRDITELADYQRTVGAELTKRGGREDAKYAKELVATARNKIVSIDPSMSLGSRGKGVPGGLQANNPSEGTMSDDAEQLLTELVTLAGETTASEMWEALELSETTGTVADAGGGATHYRNKNTVVSVPEGGTTLFGGIKPDFSTEGRVARKGYVDNGRHGLVVGDSDFESKLSKAQQRDDVWFDRPWGAVVAPSSGGGGRRKDLEMLGDSEQRLERKMAIYDFYGEARGFGRQLSEQYISIHENSFVPAVGGEAISTFSIDVDTASYANMRRFLTSGQLPPRDSIRLEELINYFDYDYAQPKGDDPFSVNMELASCPWSDGHKLLRVGLKGKDVHVNERPPTNVVFLIDVSGSMNDQNKLPLLKQGFQMMVKQLNENDRVSIVTYAGNAGVVLEPTIGDQTKTINEAIERLTSGGSTHGSAGIELAYQLAQKNFIQDGVNKVILATDGDLNVGVTSDDALVKLIKQKASEGVFLTVLGFGTGNLKDGKLEGLADNGNGLYAYIDSLREAHKVLVQQMSGSLVTIAKDVKIQIEFNPAEVKSYRLLGYENRLLATEDFDNDRKDAGEIGAGHSVTAIYEIVTTNEPESMTSVVPAGLKYQTAVKAEPKPAATTSVNLSDAAKSGELATLALRYKQPDANTSQRIEFSIKNDDKSFATASDDFRFASSVASFGMLLRGSVHSGTASLDQIQEVAAGAMGDDPSGYRAEFLDLLRKAAEIQR